MLWLAARQTGRRDGVMDALPSATLEEESLWPDWIYTFHMWMLSAGKKENTAKSYASQMRMLYEDDGKSPSAMASPEYFRLTRDSYKNKSGNGQRSASVRMYTEFYTEHMQSGAKLRKTDGSRIYQVKPREEAAKRSDKFQDRLDKEAEAPEAQKVRSELVLPDDWHVVWRERTSGDLFAAISPGGTAYSSKQAVDKRLNRIGGVPGAAPTPAKTAKAAKPAGRPPKAAKAPASPPASPPSEAGKPPPEGTGEPAGKPGKRAAPSKPAKAAKAPPPAAPQAVSTEEIVAALKGTPVRRQMLLKDALMLAFFNANVANGAPPHGGGKRREAFVVKGRDPEKRLTARIHGLYVAEDQVIAGRPVYRKADMEKSTYICYNEEKNLWRICHQVDAKGDFAKVKDKGDRPWKASKPWKIFGQDKEYVEDADLKLEVMDGASFSSNEEVEVCLPELPAGAFGVPAPAPAAEEVASDGEPPAKRPRSGSSDDS